jgi:hypothetical protein
MTTFTPDTGGDVFICSDPTCGKVWDADPNGPCPFCRKADGSGSSTMRRQVWSLGVYTADDGAGE